MTQLSIAPPSSRLERKAQLQYIQKISKKSLFPWTLHALIDWIIIILSILLAGRENNPAAYFLALLVIGNRQHALAILGHDGAHFNVHKNRKINDFLSNLFCFWPLMITVDGYRALHLKHHKNNGTEHDPELMHKRARAPQWDLPTTPLKILSYAAKDIFGYSLPDLMIIVTFSKPEKKSLIIPTILLHLAGNALLFSMGLWWVSAIWYLAIAATFMMFFRLRLWLEHQATDDTLRIHLNWWQKHLLAPHNIWLHWEHHKWPTVPYHQLENARKLSSEPTPISLAGLAQLIKTYAPRASGEVFVR